MTLESVKPIQYKKMSRNASKPSPFVCTDDKLEVIDTHLEWNSINKNTQNFVFSSDKNTMFIKGTGKKEGTICPEKKKNKPVGIFDRCF